MYNTLNDMSTASTKQDWLEQKSILLREYLIDASSRHHTISFAFPDPGWGRSTRHRRIGQGPKFPPDRTYKSHIWKRFNLRAIYGCLQLRLRRVYFTAGRSSYRFPCLAATGGLSIRKCSRHCFPLSHTLRQAYSTSADKRIPIVVSSQTQAEL